MADTDERPQYSWTESQFETAKLASDGPPATRIADAPSLSEQLIDSFPRFLQSPSRGWSDFVSTRLPDDAVWLPVLAVLCALVVVWVATVAINQARRHFLDGLPGGKHYYFIRADAPDRSLPAQFYRGAVFCAVVVLAVWAWSVAWVTAAIAADTALAWEGGFASAADVASRSLGAGVFAFLLVVKAFVAICCVVVAGIMVASTPLAAVWICMQPLKVTYGRKPGQRSAAEPDPGPAPGLVEALSRHDELLETWTRWHTDLDLILSRPAFHDMDEGFAADAVKAHNRAAEARKASEASPSNIALAEQLAAAVEQFAEALETAEDKAELLGREVADPVLMRVVEKAGVLLEQMRDDSRADWERRGAAKRLARVLKPLIGEPDPSMPVPELESAQHLELEQSPQSV
jgi:hypothetical protein